MKQNQQKDESIEDVNFKTEDLKRSRMHQHQIVEWLKKRKNQNIKKKYINYPDEMKRDLQIKKVFIDIDKDGSYQLQWAEFKQIAINAEANKQFTQMMRELREIAEKEEKQKQIENEKKKQNDQLIYEKLFHLQKPKQQTQEVKNLQFIPTNFGDMISYLSYCNSRQETMQNVESINKSDNLVEKFKHIENLFNLTKQYEKASKTIQKTNNTSNKKRLKNTQTDMTGIKNQSRRQQQLKDFFQELEQKKFQNQEEKQEEVLILPQQSFTHVKIHKENDDDIYQVTEQSQGSQQEQNATKEKQNSEIKPEVKQLTKEQLRAIPFEIKKKTILPKGLKDVHDILVEQNKQLSNTSNLYAPSLANESISLTFNDPKYKIEKNSQIRPDVQNFLQQAQSKFGLNTSISSIQTNFKNLKTHDRTRRVYSLQQQKNTELNNNYDLNDNKFPKINKNPHPEQILEKQSIKIPTDLMGGIKQFCKIDEYRLQKSLGFSFYKNNIKTLRSYQSLNKFSSYNNLSNAVFSTDANFIQSQQISTEKNRNVGSQEQLIYKNSTEKKLYQTEKQQLATSEQQQQQQQINNMDNNFERGGTYTNFQMDQKFTDLYEQYQDHKNFSVSELDQKINYNRSFPYLDSRRQAKRIYEGNRLDSNVNKSNSINNIHSTQKKNSYRSNLQNHGIRQKEQNQRETEKNKYADIQLSVLNKK